jgi:hypothetical protein
VKPTIANAIRVIVAIAGTAVLDFFKNVICYHQSV